MLTACLLGARVSVHTCSTCGGLGPFHRRGANGLQSLCKACNKQAQREHVDRRGRPSEQTRRRLAREHVATVARLGTDAIDVYPSRCMSHFFTSSPCLEVRARRLFCRRHAARVYGAED